jgi:hypothetical protein
MTLADGTGSPAAWMPGSGWPPMLEGVGTGKEDGHGT